MSTHVTLKAFTNIHCFLKLHPLLTPPHHEKSQHTAHTQGSVLMRTAIRKARWLMLSATAVLLQKCHVDAHGKDIHRGSSGKKDCFLYIHHIQPSVRNWLCHSTVCHSKLNTTLLERWHRFKYLQSPWHHEPRCCQIYYKKGWERPDRAVTKKKYCLWDLAEKRKSQTR